ncbi:MAG: DUF6134 family protein [Gammaproteobacteria bacterium]|nr:DUF6134 family protein [Gammaproteobacteria bacterium]
MTGPGRAWLLGGCMLLAAAPGLATDVGVDELAFDVLLDEQPIGSHVFRFRDGGGERRVESRASFDVRVLFVPVYSYRHSNDETWRDGCLVAIRSQTDSNGEAYAVTGERAGDAFELVTRDASQQVASDCLMTFAYWRKDFLHQDRLLNAQTGELIDVDVRALGELTLDLPQGRVDVDGYRILSAADAVDIRVYYDRRDDRWVGLRSTLENGRVMHYRPRAADAADPGRPQTAQTAKEE